MNLSDWIPIFITLIGAFGAYIVSRAKREDAETRAQTLINEFAKEFKEENKRLQLENIVLQRRMDEMMKERDARREELQAQVDGLSDKNRHLQTQLEQVQNTQEDERKLNEANQEEYIHRIRALEATLSTTAQNLQAQIDTVKAERDELVKQRAADQLEIEQLTMQVHVLKVQSSMEGVDSITPKQEENPHES